MKNISEIIFIITISFLGCGKQSNSKSMLPNGNKVALKPISLESSLVPLGNNVSIESQIIKSTSTNKTNEIDLEKFEQKLMDTDDAIERQMYKSQLKDSNVVLILGPTGSGKSTLTGGLLGKKMKKEIIKSEKNILQKYDILDSDEEDEFDDDDDDEYDDNEYYVSYEESGSKNPKIGSRIGNSETYYPTPYFHQEEVTTGSTKKKNLKTTLEKFTFCDYPGFFETRGIIPLIGTIYGNNKFLSSCDKIKSIMLVTPKSSFEANKGNQFISGTVKMIESMFVKSDDDPIRSILFLFSKFDIPRRTRALHKIMANIGEFISEYQRLYSQKDLSNSDEISLCNDILTRIDNSLRKNKNIETYNPMDGGETRKHILKKIIKSKPISKDKIKTIGSEQTKRELITVEKQMIDRVLPILDSLRTNKSVIDKLQKSLDSLTTRIATDDEQISKLENDINDLIIKKDEIQLQINNLISAKEDANTKILEIEAQRKINERDLIEQVNQVSSAEVSIETDHKIELLNRKILELTNKKNQLDTKLTLLENEQERLEKRKRELLRDKTRDDKKITQNNVIRDNIIADCNPDKFLELFKEEKCIDWLSYHSNDLHGLENWVNQNKGFGIVAKVIKKIDGELVGKNVKHKISDLRERFKSVDFNKLIGSVVVFNGDSFTLQYHLKSSDRMFLSPGSNSAPVTKCQHTYSTLNCYYCYLQNYIYRNKTLSSYIPRYNSSFNSDSDRKHRHNSFYGIVTYIKQSNDSKYTLNSIFSLEFYSRNVMGKQHDLCIRQTRISYVKNNKEEKKITLSHGDHGVPISFAQSNDSKILAVALVNKNIYFYDYYTQGKLNSFATKHNHQVFLLKFSPDDKILATTSYDNCVKLWNITNLNDVKEIKSIRYNEQVHGMDFNNAKGLFCVNSLNKIHEYSLPELLGRKNPLCPMFDLDAFKKSISTPASELKGYITEYYAHKAKELDTTTEPLEEIAEEVKSAKVKEEDIINRQSQLETQIGTIDEEILKLRNEKISKIKEERNKKSDEQKEIVIKNNDIDNTKTELRNKISKAERDIELQNESFNNVNAKLASVENEISNVKLNLSGNKNQEENLKNELKLLQTQKINIESNLNQNQNLIYLLYKLESVIPMNIIPNGPINQLINESSRKEMMISNIYKNSLFMVVSEAHKKTFDVSHHLDNHIKLKIMKYIGLSLVCN